MDAERGRRLLAAGRDSEIFEFGPGLVVRRARSGRSLEAEARVMDHVRAHGFPVPAVHEVRAGGSEIVMERVDGPSMLGAMQRRPWTLREHAGILAGLHERLHAVPAPDWLPPLGPHGAGDEARVVHMDLHPLNVIMGGDGPVVIDWPNARAGNPHADVALTWLLLAAAEPPTGIQRIVVRPLRRVFLDAFLGRVDVAAAARHLRVVTEHRMNDWNLSDAEKARMWRVVEVSSGGPGEEESSGGR